MATTADIKNGMCIELNGKTFSVVEFLHVKPGKGPAFVRTKLKNLENGRILDKTFSAGERIEPVRVERRPYQYLYSPRRCDAFPRRQGSMHRFRILQPSHAVFT